MNSPISWSHAGFMDLQWPHQGARNLMKTLFPAVSESQFAGVNSIAEAVATSDSNTDFRATMIRLCGHNNCSTIQVAKIAQLELRNLEN